MIRWQKVSGGLNGASVVSVSPLDELDLVSPVDELDPVSSVDEFEKAFEYVNLLDAVSVLLTSAFSVYLKLFELLIFSSFILQNSVTITAPKILLGSSFSWLFAL